MATLRDTPPRGGMSTDRQPNQALREALHQADWSPRDLVRVLNARLEAVGEPTLHLTASRSWLRGAHPRSRTVRRLTATVLTEATGTPYTVTGLWGGQQHRATSEKTATDDLIGPRALEEVLATATAWTATGLQGQAVLRSASEAQLFSAVWDATRQRPLSARPGGAGAEEVLPPLMDALEDHLRNLRRLDDTAGGGALAQRYVRTELAGLLDLLRNSRHTPAIGVRLLKTASGMAQLAGWMAFDADLTAAAQRYQLLAIRLARATDDTNTTANVLGMLAYQHAACDKPAAALRFAQAAVDHTARSLPTVRARALGRLATAHAAAGDINACRAATDQCRTLLTHRRDDDPPALYYFTADQVDAECGHALVELATANPVQARSLLTEAIQMLTPLTAHGPTSGFTRSALLHSIHLARAHLLTRDAEATIHTLRRCVDHLPEVQSIRCRNLLGRLRRHTGTHIRSAEGADALKAVDRALSAP